MRTGSRTFRWLALFLIVDAGVYLATAREFTGGALIAATAGAFGYLAFVVGGAVRRATRELNAEPSGDVGAVELDHVGSTIWPAGFALSAIMLAFGAVVIRWLLVPGGVLFVASALGWAADVRHQHEAHHPAPAGSVSHAPETPAP
jgi:Cytochrome c oxidase subunit IV.